MKTSTSSRASLLSQQGLTLPEILVALAIVGILGSLAMSSFMSSVQSQSLSAASLQLAEWLENTRKRAIQQNKPCRVEVSTTLSLLKASTTNECGAFEELNISTAISDNIKICFRTLNPLTANLGCNSSTLSSTSLVTFSPRGSVTEDYVFEFYIPPASAKACTIILKPLGLIQQGQIIDGYCKTPA